MLPCKVTYRYYIGVLGFLQEDYKKVRSPARRQEYELILPQAETELNFAFNNCHHESPRNQECVDDLRIGSEGVLICAIVGGY